MGRKKAGFTGVKEVTDNLQEEQPKMQTRVFKGLVAGLLLMKKDSQQNTPRREGNLMASHYVVFPGGEGGTSGGFKGEDSGGMGGQHTSEIDRTRADTASFTNDGVSTAAIGASAIYARRVHEDSNAGAPGYKPTQDVSGKKASQVHSQKGGWKFLENALKKTQILKKALETAARIPEGNNT